MIEWRSREVPGFTKIEARRIRRAKLVQRSDSRASYDLKNRLSKGIK